MARLRGYGRDAAQRVTDNLIERFDIGEFRDKLVKSVSGGQRRRVDLAASLVVQPKVLILDEPTTGLDPRSRQVVWNTIRELVGAGRHALLDDPVPRRGRRAGRLHRPAWITVARPRRAPRTS